VSISDIHGYLDDARQALLTLDDYPNFEPVITADSDCLLHWADDNYVLVFDGDLVDCGLGNDAVIAVVTQLIERLRPAMAVLHKVIMKDRYCSRTTTLLTVTCIRRSY
jgi:hypothetical protein